MYTYLQCSYSVRTSCFRTECWRCFCCVTDWMFVSRLRVMLEGLATPARTAWTPTPSTLRSTSPWTQSHRKLYNSIQTQSHRKLHKLYFEFWRSLLYNWVCFFLTWTLILRYLSICSHFIDFRCRSFSASRNSNLFPSSISRFHHMWGSHLRWEFIKENKKTNKKKEKKKEITLLAKKKGKKDNGQEKKWKHALSTKQATKKKKEKTCFFLTSLFSFINSHLCSMGHCFWLNIY